MANDEYLRELEDKYEGYKVYDNSGDKIGKVDDLFVDENDREEYIGVKMGLFGLSGTTLIPIELVRVNEGDRAIEVAESKEHVKDAPNFSDDDEITREFEERIRRHFGLEGAPSSASRGSYDRYSESRTGDLADRNDEYPSEDEYEATGSSGATGGAATGGVRDLETGDRVRSEEDEYGGSRERDDYSGVSAEDSGDGEYRRSEGADRESEGTADYSSEDSTDRVRFEESGDDRETREMPLQSSEEESGARDEGGRTRVRKRVIREEVEYLDDESDRR